MRNEYLTEAERKLRNHGRVLTGWWGDQPIHRPMTNEERAASIGLGPLSAAFANALLGNPNYKPRV